MIDTETIIYRSARTFPPGDGDYQTLSARRGHPVGRTPVIQRASTGLSVYLALENARINGRRNGHIIGFLIVRYTLPVGANLSVEWLVGDKGHFTLLGPDLPLLPTFLDRTWSENLQQLPEGNHHG